MDAAALVAVAQERAVKGVVALLAVVEAVPPIVVAAVHQSVGAAVHPQIAVAPPVAAQAVIVGLLQKGVAQAAGEAVEMDAAPALMAGVAHVLLLMDVVNPATVHLVADNNTIAGYSV